MGTKLDLVHTEPEDVVRSVNIHDAKTHLSRLVDEVSAGEEIIIAKAGKPLARLIPFRAGTRRRKLGVLTGRFSVPDDFDAPLPSEIIEDFEGR
jgi:prevent-host-death family protein